MGKVAPADGFGAYRARRRVLRRRVDGLGMEEFLGPRLDGLVKENGEFGSGTAGIEGTCLVSTLRPPYGFPSDLAFSYRARSAARRAEAPLRRGRLLAALPGRGHGAIRSAVSLRSRAGAPGGTLPPGAELAQAEIGRRRLPAASRAQALGAALGGAAMKALAVTRAKDRWVSVGHRGCMDASRDAGPISV